jgi:hypothetical protein
MGNADKRSDYQHCCFGSIKLIPLTKLQLASTVYSRLLVRPDSEKLKSYCMKFPKFIVNDAVCLTLISGLFFQTDKIPDFIGKRCVLKFLHWRAIWII